MNKMSMKRWLLLAGVLFSTPFLIIGCIPKSKVRQQPKAVPTPMQNEDEAQGVLPGSTEDDVMIKDEGDVMMDAGQKEISNENDAEMILQQLEKSEAQQGVEGGDSGNGDEDIDSF